MSIEEKNGVITFISGTNKLKGYRKREFEVEYNGKFAYRYFFMKNKKISGYKSKHNELKLKKYRRKIDSKGYLLYVRGNKPFYTRPGTVKEIEINKKI